MEALTQISPEADSQLQDSAAQHYRMVVQVILKETESGRDNKGHSFGSQVIEGSSIVIIKEKLWRFVLSHLQPQALYTGLPKAPPTFEDFDKYIAFKFNKLIIPN
ncbi:hypothetical protein AC1031_006466 [Aphanomyces cochlioides]|nr:hypothetical protein AC1031_006466 [Aphanomyces cochlioides]